jgi:hypothetical protein
MERSRKLERRASELLEDREGCVPPQAWHSGVNDADLIIHTSYKILALLPEAQRPDKVKR